MRVIINNFNRLEPLLKLVSWLKRAENVSEIIIVDNCSTYEPLLDYYTSTEFTIHKAEKNYRFSGLKKYVEKIPEKESFIVTDSDIVPHENCPLDLIPKLSYFSERYKKQDILKVGPGLYLEDIPDKYPLKYKILLQQENCRNNAAKFVQIIESDSVIPFKIDTVFALYRERRSVGKVRPCITMKYPYVVRHMDWYEDPQSFTEEYKNYLSTANEMSTTTRTMKEWIGQNR